MQLSDYTKAERGNAKRMAAGLGVSLSYLCQMAAPGRAAFSARRCVQIEALSNLRVRRWDLRPHDWHLIWPELVGTPGAPVVGAYTDAGAEAHDAPTAMPCPVPE